MGSKMVPIANSLALWGPSARVTSCPAIDFLDALALHASMQCDAYFGSSPRILSWGETRGTLPCARRKGVGSRAAPVAGRGALREEDGEEESAPISFPLSLSSFFLPWRLATAVGHVPRAPRGPHPVAQGPSPDNPLAGGERRCPSLSVSAWVVPGGRQNARLFVIRSILEAVLVSCF